MNTTLPPEEWNETARSYPPTLLPELVAAQAAATPDATAVRFRDEALSYAELDARIERLAGRLVALGLAAGTPVAVCLERSIELVVALHAVLRAGGAYLPIDPEYPDERIALMLDDLDEPMVLTRPPLAGRLDRLGARVIIVDADEGETPATTVALPKIEPDKLAYVIYTSGSTGRPKGAMITHRAIANRIHWMQEHFGLTADDRVLQKTPFSFDVSVWEFFWPLAFGAQLVVAEPGGHRDNAYLTHTIIDTGITTIHFVPSMLQLFLEDPRASECLSLRRVICSGEALPRALQDRFFERLDTELHNLYGPTEAAVDVSAWACDPRSELPFVPIGKPIANTQLHILGEALQPVPVGHAGELHIGGVQVGRGYLKRPELTAERFIGDPFRAGGTLYKTGDLARYLPSGDIEFLGRSDFQVKIRGFRVELGEIEAALDACEGVRGSVVVAHASAAGETELVAYVACPEGEVESDVLRRHLGQRLPEHMIPTRFIPVERFPLTSNGKIDRQALPTPERTRPRPALEAPYVAPRSALERHIAAAWQAILDLDRVGAHDRFFELGGSSLQAARFVNQVQSELGESIFVVTLFSAPSVAEYAAFLEQQYPDAVARLLGAEAAQTAGEAGRSQVSEAELDRFRSIVPVLRAAGDEGGTRNPSAIFILSPPRSGTTLLRIMLAGHRDLFAASELQLLGFATMAEQAAAYSGRFSNWLDGIVRAVMETDGVGADEAKSIVAAAAAEGTSTKSFFGRLQAAVAPRVLVDKSPSYALDPRALRKAEADFESPRYIHLVRHPVAMIDSFARHHMEQVLYLREHAYDARQLAELVWTASHRTIDDFLTEVPSERWHRLRYEDLVADPQAEIASLCAALGLAYDEAATHPYDGLERKMIDGVYRESAPMGDPGFLAHGRIDPSSARLPTDVEAASLGAPTIRLARAFGYGTRAGISTGEPDGDRYAGAGALPHPGREAALPTGARIAIVGMAGRFPGADDVDDFWDNLCRGVESIRPLSEEELRAAGADTTDPDLVRAAAALDDFDAFDAEFFGISRREAELTDPQHRVFLETARAAIEHAGYDPAAVGGRTGIFGGVAANTYLRRNLMARPDLLARTGDYALLLATEREYAITRTAYKLDLDGPAMSVNTACSTSGVAIHLAVQSLRAGECDLALAGGARIRVPPTGGYVYEEDGILSPDGHCRTFDADARGTVPASGVAIVALKRLDDALRDGDTVYAVIQGTAVNNDGAAKIGFTAPGVDGQAAVVERALAMADVGPDSIGMLEAHGTATSLGDPIEVEALTRVFRRGTDRRGYCAIGSLKSNIGHLDAGAGVAGVIKAALSLYHERIPPSINYRAPNRQIDFESSPFFVNTELRPWPRTELPRRAGVSSFGLGGTNAHVVLEEAPLAERPPAGVDAPVLLTLSAKSAPALARQRQQLADHLATHPQADLRAVAYTLAHGRSQLPYRHAVVAPDREQAIARLRDPEAMDNGPVGAETTGVAFLFPGQGAQHLGMAAGTYRSEPEFRSAIDECAAILEPLIDRDLRELIDRSDSDDALAASALEAASVAQPATVAVEYALARLWMSWGVRPAAMVGHSLGEFTAACLGGVFGLADMLELVAARGRLMEARRGGAMLAVMAAPERVTPLLDERSAIAAVNAPGQIVAAGPTGSMEALAASLADASIRSQRLPIGLAAHSPLMEPMADELAQRIEDVHRGRLSIPMVSTMTGTWLEEGALADPGYWRDHALRTVRFADAVGRLLERPDLALLEVGPGQTLTSLAAEHPAASPERTIVSSLPHPRLTVDDREHLLDSLGALWRAGVEVDRAAVYGSSGRRVALPTYPFERTRHWIDGPAAAADETHHADGASSTAMDARGSATRSTAPAAPRAEEPRAEASGSAAAASRADRIAAQLVSIIGDLSGVEPAELDRTASFADLGFDSLFLTQANSQFRKRFGVRITFRQLFEEAPSILALASFIDSRLEPETAVAAAPAEAVPGSPPATEAASRASASGRTASDPDGAASRLEQLMTEQSRLLQQQLELVRSNPPSGGGVEPIAASSGPPATDAAGEGPVRHHLSTQGQGPRPKRESHALDERQQRAIDELVRRTNARTAESKKRAQLWRPRLADNRTIVGFDQAWKELVYQIVSDRSHGSRIWDIDGNEYIDTALGYGTNLFGHAPEFVVAAIREQLERGYEVGTQNRFLGEVSELACRLTGSQRMAYTTSGGEAVETAIRVARTVTGRDRVAYFSDAIHGRSDVVLGRGLELHGELRTVPLVAGVPQGVMDDAVVLAYGTERALEIIRAQARELALVLVEPVRTRNPDLQPVEFLRELRLMADEHGFLLVFDEIVTGFRADIGGVQALFDIRADLTTYGKVLGGGLPIGAVAGASRYVDVIDGGSWTFGDSSFPEADITASGGTFIKHPLTLAAARAVLRHLEQRGPSLQQQLNHRAAEAVGAINEAFRQDGIPIHIEHFSSFFRPTFTESSRFAGLFQYYLRERGVHTNPPSPSFLSTAHSDPDVEAIVGAYIESGRAMARDGLLERQRTSDAATPTRAVPAQAATRVPILPNVARFLVDRDSPEPHHWNLGVMLRPEYPLDEGRVRATIARLIERHDALRLRFVAEEDGWGSFLAPTTEPLPVSRRDLSDLPEEEQRHALERAADEIQRSLDLAEGPLFRVALFELGDQDQRLLTVIHHFAMDGISWRPFWEDFETIYRGLEQGSTVDLPPRSTTFEEWASTLSRRADSTELQAELGEWVRLPWERVRPIPLDHEGGRNTNGSARQVMIGLSAEETSRLLYETPAIDHKTDLLMTTLARVLAEWSESDTALFDVMGHGRDEDTHDEVDLFGSVGFFVSYTPLVVTLDADEGSPTPIAVSDQIQPVLRRGLDFDLLRYMSNDAGTRQALGALPRAQVLFNHLGKRDELDAVPRGSMFRLAAESIGSTHSPKGLRYYPLAISSEIWKDELRLRFVFSENLHQRRTIETLAGRFRQVLNDSVARARTVRMTETEKAAD